MARSGFEIEWQVAGEVRLRDGLRFPALDPLPGVYRISVGKEVYIGEADNLARALQRFRTPGASQPTNLRIHEWLHQVLVGRAAGQVALLPSDTSKGHLDLARGEARRRVKTAAVEQAIRAGMTVLNLRW